jgi:tRNA threonylcarbamoyladenosine biosynthesis protein TsaB
MKLLALDSATDACSVALNLDGQVSERFEIAPRRHTQLLLPMTQTLLAEAGMVLRDLDLLAFTHGPGSFTGLRITLGIVQGLAFGLDRPVVGISTLAAMAERSLRMQGGSRVAVAVDARMGQVYWGEYARDDAGDCVALAEDSLRDPEKVPRLEAGKWLAAGAGWRQYAQALQQASGLHQGLDEAIDIYPHAADVALLAANPAVARMAVPALMARPCYLRDKVAEKMVKT